MTVLLVTVAGLAMFAVGIWVGVTAERQAQRAERRLQVKSDPRIGLIHDTEGSGHIWQVYYGNLLIWSHAAIEGPPPDALDLWNALARYLPVGE